MPRPGGQRGTGGGAGPSGGGAPAAAAAAGGGAGGGLGLLGGGISVLSGLTANTAYAGEGGGTQGLRRQECGVCLRCWGGGIAERHAQFGLSVLSSSTAFTPYARGTGWAVLLLATR
jgi:hypothetical protein